MEIVACKELDTNRPRLALDGRWAFSNDPRGVGRREQWFAPEHTLPERTQVPGCPQVRHHRSAGKAAAAFDGLPEARAGTLLRDPCFTDAWFKRRFRVPTAWRGQRIWLHIGGVKPTAELWLNGRRLGRTVSSRTPLRCDITRHITFGEVQTLTVRVAWTNRQLSGVFDTMGWSGLYRSVWLEAVPAAHIADLRVRTNVGAPSAAFAVRVLGPLPPSRRTQVRLDIAGIGFRQRFTAPAEPPSPDRAGEWTAVVPMPGARLWSPDTPGLYSVTATLLENGVTVDSAGTRFGLREITTDGFRVLLNGLPVFLRGGCDDHYYPHSVSPPADKGFYVERIRTAKRFGFNYTKSCVDVFTREFLDAADELGYLVCQEMPFGVFGKMREQRFAPPEWMKRLCRQELTHIVNAYADHASVVCLSMSSELHQGWLDNPDSFALFSRELPALARELAPDTLVFDCTGASDSAVECKSAVPIRTRAGTRDTDLDGSWLLWNQECTPLLGPIPGLEDVTRPFICHEYCWFTALSDPSLATRMRRLPMVPLHVPDMIAAARRNGQADELPTMVACSRRLQHALRKHAFELARLDPKVAGYHHWLIHDFPFCAEGVVNEFWEPPDDLSASDFRRCNADTVLCLVDGGRRCFTHGETPELRVAVSHFGATELQDPVLQWRLTANGRSAGSGRTGLQPGPGRPPFSERQAPRTAPCVPPGHLAHSTPLDIRLGSWRRPVRLELRAELHAAGRRVATNVWTLWSFPEAPLARTRDAFATTLPSLAATCPAARLVADDPAMPAPGEVWVTDSLSAPALAFLRGGGRLLLLAPALSRGQDLPRGEGATRYRTVPYNMGTTGNMGTVIREHPALDAFPHDGWCDFVFEPLIEGASPFTLHPFHPRRIRPIIRSIGHMRTMEDKAYLFEVNVGHGRLLACSLRVMERLGNYPAADYLLAELLRYLHGGRLEKAPMVQLPAGVAEE